MDMILVGKILKLPEEQLNTLFKPKQQSVLKKVLSGDELDDNQKRYLRGDVRNKLELVRILIEGKNTSPLQNFTSGLENYYISGYDALKHNGYGWYFDTKRILIYNTRLKGTYHIPGKLIIAKRVKSLRTRGYERDPRTGIIYADNAQILKDAIAEGEEALVRECMSHLQRYGDLFIEDPEGVPDRHEGSDLDPGEFGV